VVLSHEAGEAVKIPCISMLLESIER
jgi:hypothetical protein